MVGRTDSNFFVSLISDPDWVGSLDDQPVVNQSSRVALSYPFWQLYL